MVNFKIEWQWLCIYWVFKIILKLNPRLYFGIGWSNAMDFDTEYETSFGHMRRGAGIFWNENPSGFFYTWPSWMLIGFQSMPRGCLHNYMAIEAFSGHPFMLCVSWYRASEFVTRKVNIWYWRWINFMQDPIHSHPTGLFALALMQTCPNFIRIFN